ncbi:hypothetical protein HKX48_008058 [Thoreauomyces humboldtii]|nr:hypothetical protein HKX48_008058 [Thoreauomyces humboldtii]
MTRILPTLFALLGAAAVANAAICVSSDMTYANQTASLVQEALTVNGTAYTVTGTVKIIDGCTFEVQNFINQPGYNDTLWYGRTGTNGSTGIRVWGTAGSVNTTVQPYQDVTSPVYTLEYTVAGQSASWYDFDTLVLYAIDNSLVFATATFAGLKKTTTSTTATSTKAAVATTTAPVVKTTTTQATSTTIAPVTVQAAAAAATTAVTEVDAHSGAEGLSNIGGLAIAGLAAAAVAAAGF